MWHNFGAQCGAQKGNQARQIAEVDTGMDSHRETETNDPNSEQWNTEKYYMNLGGWAEPKTHTSEPLKSSSLWVSVTQWHHWLVIEKGSMSNWPLFSYIQVLLSILLGDWHYQFIQYLYQCIKTNLKRNNKCISLTVFISWNSEIVKMLTSSTVSIPLIPNGDSSQRAIILW